MFSLFKNENKFEKDSIKPNFSGWFSGWFNKKDSNSSKVKIGKISINVPNGDLRGVASLIKEIEKLPESHTKEIEIPKIISENTISDNIPLINEKRLANISEEKRKIDDKIKETKALIELNRFDDAQNLLFKILGEIQEKKEYINEQVRVYNNLGFIYNHSDGDFDKAIKYFNIALEKDPNFHKSKMNLAFAYLNKGDKESINKGNDLIKDLWKEKKKPEILQTLLWGIYKKEKSPKKVIEFIEDNPGTQDLIDKKDSLLHLLAGFYIELRNPDKALEYSEKSISISGEEPEFLMMKARALMLKSEKDYSIPSDLDVIPKFSDYEAIEKALDLFKKAQDITENQNKKYLLPDIAQGISTCFTWLRMYKEATNEVKGIDLEKIPEEVVRNIEILDFANNIQQRNFELAYKILEDSDNYKKLSYREKFRLSVIFISNGAPEQAKSILDDILLEAEKNGDINYWKNLSVIYILLNDKNKAISVANKIKELAENKKDKEIQKSLLLHYNAIMNHYSYSGESERMVEGMLEFDRKFPEEKIMTKIKAIDEKEELTDEIKNIFESAKKRFDAVKQFFKNNPAPTYFLEKENLFNRSYAEIMALPIYGDDADFVIPFTDVNKEFLDNLKENFEKEKGFVFDYLSLLDLSKMDFLGFLEKLNKPIFIHQLLFNKIQKELLQNEIPELRKLWEFLRHNKNIKFIEGKIDIECESDRLEDNVFEKWLIETIKFAKANNYSICTDDLRLYQYLKSEKINPINIFILLKDWLENKIIDKRAYSRAIGSLAERHYVFLSYDAEDLLEIVLEDKGKITPRSYYLIREIFLEGSEIGSFAGAFAKFIDKFWKTGSLPQEKVNWIKFITNTLTEIMDKDFEPMKNLRVNKEKAEELIEETREKLSPAISALGFIWKTATNSGNKNDLRELFKISDEVLNKQYLENSKIFIKKGIEERLEKLNK